MSDKNRFSDSSAKSYSQALYELASEEKNLNNVEEHVVSLIKLISKSEDFNLLIEDPTNKQEDQLNVINVIFEKFNLNTLLKKFLNFLVIKRRFFYVEKILKDFVMICSKSRGEISAKLTVAKELNENEINKNFRYRILIRSKKTQKIQKTLSNILNNFKNQKEIKLAVDVDPISFN